MSVLGAYCYARELNSLVEQAAHKQNMNPTLSSLYFIICPVVLKKATKKKRWTILVCAYEFILHD